MSALDLTRIADSTRATMVASMDTGRQHFPAEYVAEARGWIMDCEWGDLDMDEVPELPTRTVLRAVDHHFAGGLSGFADAVWC